MPLWGKSTTNEAKPKYLTSDQKQNCYATSRGWVYKHPNGSEELLVAISGLSTLLANADVTGFYFTDYANTYTRNANGYVTLTWNEKITVTGSPTIVVNGSSANATATYDSGSGTNKITFKFTVPNSAQTLSLRGQTITLAGGTLVDSASAAVNLGFANNVVTGIRGRSAAANTVAVA